MAGIHIINCCSQFPCRCQLTPAKLALIFQECPELLKYHVPCEATCDMDGKCIICDDEPDIIRRARKNKHWIEMGTLHPLPPFWEVGPGDESQDPDPPEIQN